jgi:hypothetical protein
MERNPFPTILNNIVFMAFFSFEILALVIEEMMIDS